MVSVFIFGLTAPTGYYHCVEMFTLNVLQKIVGKMIGIAAIRTRQHGTYGTHHFSFVIVCFVESVDGMLLHDMIA